MLKVILTRAGDTEQKFALSNEIRLWFGRKRRVRISSNKPYDLGDNLAKTLDGHRSKRIKQGLSVMTSLGGQKIWDRS